MLRARATSGVERCRDRLLLDVLACENDGVVKNKKETASNGNVLTKLNAKNQVRIANFVFEEVDVDL